MPERAGGHEQQYGGFVNGLYDFNIGLPVFPYVGAGVGYQEVELDNVNSGPANGFIPSGGKPERAGNFAYQGIAGLSYPLSAVPGLSLTVEYRFIGVQTPSPAYQRNNGGLTINGRSGGTNFTNIFDHDMMFGLRYAFDQLSAPALDPAVAIPFQGAVSPVRTYLVFFDWDRADLTGRARQIVAEAANASLRVQTTRIHVGGYTDRSGGVAYNDRLSLRRAKIVQAELVRDGVPLAEIVVQGFGENNPLVPTASGMREPQNRRVEIVLR